MQLLTLLNQFHLKFHCFIISSVNPQLLEKKYEKYESMTSHTFSLENFSEGKFFLFIYLFLEIYQSVMSYNNVILRGEKHGNDKPN